VRGSVLGPRVGAELLADRKMAEAHVRVKAIPRPALP
jgi:hypothetical protein